jgi:hypothetical protein
MADHRFLVACHPAALRNLLPVLVGVMLAGLLGMMNRMHVMTMRNMGVVAGLRVVPRLVMIRRRAMVLRGMFVVLGCFAMMLDSFS